MLYRGSDGRRIHPSLSRFTDRQAQLCLVVSAHGLVKLLFCRFASLLKHSELRSIGPTDPKPHFSGRVANKLHCRPPTSDAHTIDCKQSIAKIESLRRCRTLAHGQDYHSIGWVIREIKHQAVGRDGRRPRQHDRLRWQALSSMELRLEPFSLS
eukprot:5526652-Prymnesium_polylepis.1